MCYHRVVKLVILFCFPKFTPISERQKRGEQSHVGDKCRAQAGAKQKHRGLVMLKKQLAAFESADADSHEIRFPTQGGPGTIWQVVQ